MKLKNVFLISLVVILSLIAFGCQSQFVRSAKLYMQQGNPDEALKQLQKGSEAEPANPEIWYELGVIQADLGNYEEMNKAFDKSLEIGPTFQAKIKTERLVRWDKHHRNGATLGNQNKFDEALKEFHLAEIIDSKQAQTQFGLGWSYSKLGQHENAIKHLEKSVELDPADVNSWHQLLFEYATTENMDKRIETGLRLIGQHPKDMVGLEDLARTYEITKQDSMAMIYYEKALEIDPKNGNIWFNLGALYGSKKKYEDASRCFKTALDINPNDEDSMYNLALVFNRNKQFDEALEFVEKLITLRPEAPDGYRLKGDIYRSLATKYEEEGNDVKANEFKAKTAEAFKKAQELSNSGS